MLFSSLSYIIFLPLVSLIYFIIPEKMRKAFLLISSFYFYMSWNASYGLLLLTTIVITFFTGILIEKENNDKKRKFYVFFAFFANLLILFYFKYFNFAGDVLFKIINGITKKDLSFNFLNIILPVGISFYTFQALGYVVDVYRKKVDACGNFLKYALFISFFPQVLAGPIGRAPELMKQFDEPKRFDYNLAREGLLLILWGFFKKIVIADRLAILANTVYNDVHSYAGAMLIVGTVAFSLQIYCDFSAYSEIAIGSAKILGIHLMKNFDSPFFSKSIGEFWRRWHISLSSWFRDYIYFPLGGNRKGKLRKNLNQVIIFLISGLWHGAGLTYIFWGFLNGIYLVLGEVLAPVWNFICKLLRINKDSVSHGIFQTVITFILVNFAFIFFRANSFSDAVFVVKKILYPNYWTLFDGSLLKLGLDLSEIFIAVLSVLILFMFEKKSKTTDYIRLIFKQPTLYRWALYITALIFIMVFGVYGSSYEAANFLYFQF